MAMKKGIIYISMLLVAGCYYDNVEELYPGGEGCGTGPDTYNTKIAAILSNNCALSGCHVAGAVDPNLSDSSVVYGKIDRIRERAIIQKNMPPSGPLSSCEFLALQNWISGGIK